MTHPWEPEQTLESPMALDLIREQFSELCPTKIRLLGTGWDNTAFVVNDDLIFRFPRRECAVSLLESEWWVLPKIAPHLPLPIPIPRWKGYPTPRFPWPFLGYRILPGITACYANLSEEEREAFAQPLARFLSSLHAPSLVSIAECQSFTKNVSHLHWEHLIPKTLHNFEEMSQLGFLENRKELESMVERLQDIRSPTSSAVVHGDFYVRHLLIDKEHRLAGVIDWGDMHLGDPAADLSIAHSFLPLRSHDTFRDAYGEISEDTWSLALLRALYSSTMFGLYGYHSGDQVLLREALRSLKVMGEGSHY